MSLADLTSALVSRCTFPAPGTPLVCGVSGGPDSLALLVLATVAGCRVTAVHVDHGLRPGSAAEFEVVAAAADRFGAAFRSVRVEVGEGPNLEARAREVRHRALGSEAATGHTADDQAETVLVNLLRGAGVNGLAAMRAGPRHPLLALRRSETVEVCERAGLTPVLDPSNEDPRFVRSRVRHELIPLCSAIAGRDVVPVLVRQADALAGDADILDAVGSLIDPADGASLAASPSAVGRRTVRDWLGRTRSLPSTARRRRAGAGRGPPGASGHRDPRRAARVAVPGTAYGEPAARPRPARAVPPRGATTALRYSRGVMAGGDESTDDSALSGPDSFEHGPGVGRVIVPEVDLQARIAELGVRITADYAGRPPLLIGVLKGAFMFMSDLSRAITLPVEVDFMAVSSYGSATRTSGVVRIVKDLDVDLSGRDVLVVEDIVDSGLTLSYLQRYLRARQPATLEVCALLVKDGQQRTEIDLRYVGFHIPAEFVVGYGLDVDERLRNLRAIHAHTGSST